MSNKKKFSSFKNQQSITNDWRKYLGVKEVPEKELLNEMNEALYTSGIGGCLGPAIAGMPKCKDRGNCSTDEIRTWVNIAVDCLDGSILGGPSFKNMEILLALFKEMNGAYAVDSRGMLVCAWKMFEERYEFDEDAWWGRGEKIKDQLSQMAYGNGKEMSKLAKDILLIVDKMMSTCYKYALLNKKKETQLASAGAEEEVEVVAEAAGGRRPPPRRVTSADLLPLVKVVEDAIDGYTEESDAALVLDKLKDIDNAFIEDDDGNMIPAIGPGIGTMMDQIENRFNEPFGPLFKQEFGELGKWELLKRRMGEYGTQKWKDPGKRKRQRAKDAGLDKMWELVIDDPNTPGAKMTVPTPDDIKFNDLKGAPIKPVYNPQKLQKYVAEKDPNTGEYVKDPKWRSAWEHKYGPFENDSHWFATMIMLQDPNVESFDMDIGGDLKYEIPEGKTRKRLKKIKLQEKTFYRKYDFSKQKVPIRRDTKLTAGTHDSEDVGTDAMGNFDAQQGNALLDREADSMIAILQGKDPNNPKNPLDAQCLDSSSGVAFAGDLMGACTAYNNWQLALVKDPNAPFPKFQISDPLLLDRMNEKGYKHPTPPPAAAGAGGAAAAGGGAGGGKGGGGKGGNRTIVMYKKMSDTLRGKGYEIPQGHALSLQTINKMLTDKGLSFKNGDWKNYAGMNAVLQQAYPDISQNKFKAGQAAGAMQAQFDQGKDIGMEPSRKGPIGSLSDEELAQRIADRDEAERQKKLKNWRPPSRRGPGIPTPRDNIKSSRPGSLQLQETMRQMITNQLKSSDKFKHLFKESAERQVVNAVVENLMKHDYFKNLAQKKNKVLKERTPAHDPASKMGTHFSMSPASKTVDLPKKADLTSDFSDDQLKKMTSSYLKRSGRSDSDVKAILGNIKGEGDLSAREELENMYKTLRKSSEKRAGKNFKDKQSAAAAKSAAAGAKKTKKGNRTVEAYKDMGNMLAKKGHDVPKGHKGRLQYIKKILDKAGKKAGKDFKNYGQMQAVLAAAVGADMGFAAHDAKKAKNAKEHPGAVADAAPGKKPLPNAWKNRLMQLLNKPDSVLRLSDRFNTVAYGKLLKHKELFQDQSGYDNLVKIMKRKYELRKGQDETEKAGLKKKGKATRRADANQPKYKQTGGKSNRDKSGKSKFTRGLERAGKSTFDALKKGAGQAADAFKNLEESKSESESK